MSVSGFSPSKQKPYWYNFEHPPKASIFHLRTAEAYNAVLVVIESSKTESRTLLDLFDLKEPALLITLGLKLQNREVFLQFSELSPDNIVSRQKLSQFESCDFIASTDTSPLNGRGFRTYGQFSNYLSTLAEECLWQLADDRHSSTVASAITLKLEKYGEVYYDEEDFVLKGYWDSELNDEIFSEIFIQKLAKTSVTNSKCFSRDVQAAIPYFVIFDGVSSISKENE